jgi:DNA polymerase
VEIYFIDYETYWSKDFSLSKMTPVEYILSPLFSVHGAAVMKKGGDPVWIDGPDLPAWFASLDPNKVALVSHNALFDACITAWYYDFIPRLTIDTLGMSRALNSWALKSHSLAKVAEFFGLGGKAEGGAVLQATKGMMLEDIKQSGFYPQFVEYALQDVRLCAALYEKMRPSFPTQELIIMDMVLRCALNPKFQLDADVLAEHLHLVRATKENLLAKIGIDKDALMSNERLANTLLLMGVDVPKKVSPATGNETYAFSRTDPEFMALLDHDTPEVQMLIAARLGVKSTLEETRTERLLSMSNLTWRGKPAAMMPIPLRYAGAHTHRLSGEWSLNTQNLPRGGALRRALIAPPGYKVLTVDSSQIEARIVAWICGQSDLVFQFAKNEDVYSNFASAVFGFKVDKKKNPTERFVGKTGILGLGYGVGWVKFQKTVKMQSKAQTGTQIELSDVEAQNVVGTYRRINDAVPMTWRALDNAISILAGMKSSYNLGPCVFEHGKVTLPSGLHLHYPGLEREPDGWRFTFGGMKKTLYGGKLLENIVQALARICVMDSAVAIEKRLSSFGVELAGQAHDELIYIVPDDLVDVCTATVLEEMRRRPEWAKDLPLDAEAGVGQSYGEAK